MNLYRKIMILTIPVMVSRIQASEVSFGLDAASYPQRENRDRSNIPQDGTFESELT